MDTEDPLWHVVVCAAGVVRDVGKLITAVALGILCEAYGMGIPTAVLPYVNSAQAAHPAYRQSLERLREMGVLIGSYETHRPKAVIGASLLEVAAAKEWLPQAGRESGPLSGPSPRARGALPPSGPG